MNRVILSSFALAVLVGCAQIAPVAEPEAEASVGADGQMRPQARPDGIEASKAPPPPAAARTAEQFDTTSAAQRAEAAKAPETGGERALGVTVASLGSPSEPGFWLKTPLVKVEGPGRVVYPATGKSSAVTLIPIDGPVTAGSRLSLAALRLIGAPLTGLPEVEVFAGG